MGKKEIKKLNVNDKLALNPQAKIVLDSNIFLNYLWLTETEFKTFMQIIESHTDEIIFTEQSIDELYRNLPSNFDKNKENKLSKMGTGLDPSKLKFITKEDKKILSDVKNIINKNQQANIDAYDKNYKLLKVFLDNNLNKYTIIQRTNDIVDRAIKRKFIGNPPWSDKQTVGDEIIWESLLALGKTDIIIVTGDNGFIKNKEFLIKEYNRKTTLNLIDIYDELDLTVALETIKPDENHIVAKLKDIEDNEKSWLNEKFYSNINNLSALNDIDVSVIQKSITDIVTLPAMREFIRKQNEYNEMMKPIMAKLKLYSIPNEMIKIMENANITNTLKNMDVPNLNLVKKYLDDIDNNKEKNNG